MPQSASMPRSAASVGAAPPDIEAAMAEECQRLLDSLGDEMLANVAMLKLDGFTNEEIAVKLSYTRRTIQRALATIRMLWQKEMGDD